MQKQINTFSQQIERLGEQQAAAAPEDKYADAKIVDNNEGAADERTAAPEQQLVAVNKRIESSAHVSSLKKQLDTIESRLVRVEGGESPPSSGAGSRYAELLEKLKQLGKAQHQQQDQQTDELSLSALRSMMLRLLEVMPRLDTADSSYVRLPETQRLENALEDMLRSFAAKKTRHDTHGTTAREDEQRAL